MPSYIAVVLIVHIINDSGNILKILRIKLKKGKRLSVDSYEVTICGEGTDSFAITIKPSTKSPCFPPLDIISRSVHAPIVRSSCNVISNNYNLTVICIGTIGIHLGLGVTAGVGYFKKYNGL